MPTFFRPLLLALFSIALSTSLYFLARSQPTLFLPSNSDLADPSRYAFLTETKRAAALVVDIRQKNTLGRLALPAIAEHSSIEPSTHTLALSQAQQLFTHQLNSGTQHQQHLDSPIDALASGGQHLAVRSQKRLHIYRLPELSPLQQIDLPSRNTSLHYAALQSRWLAVENPPSLIFYDQQIERISLPYQHISPAALSPDNRFLAFIAQETNGTHTAVIWSLENQTPLQSHPISNNTLRPLIDNRSQHIYFIDRSGQGLQFDSRHFDEPPKIFQSLNSVSDIALGFMETRLVLRNERQAAILDTDSLNTLTTLELPESGKGIFISADSKTALLGGKQQLFTLQLAQGKLSSIALPDTIEPKAIFMGASNTLCH